jgi:peptidoglycan L-alanyl-D-glutamate endopeptidase CwlK
MPSMAIDVAPYPIDWSDFEKFHELAGFIKATAIEHGIHIKWGGDWKSFQDMPHWELDLNYYSE